MATITFEDDGKGTLQYGNTVVRCAGLRGFNYTEDITLRPENCKRIHEGREYGSFEWAVGPVQWERGAYIHAWPNTTDESRGCIHLEEGDAIAFHDWVKGRASTRLQTTFPW